MVSSNMCLCHYGNSTWVARTLQLQALLGSSNTAVAAAAAAHICQICTQCKLTLLLALTMSGWRPALQVTSPLELNLLAEKDYFKLLVRTDRQHSSTQHSTWVFGSAWVFGRGW